MSTDDKDAIKLLKAALDFKLKNNGATPTPSKANQVHALIKGSLFTPLTDKQLYNKFRTFRRRYDRAIRKGENLTLKFGLEFLDLYKKIWGDKVSEEDEEEERNEKSEETIQNVVGENGKEEKSKKRKAKANLPEDTPKKKEKVEKEVLENNKKDDDDDDDDDEEEEEEEDDNDVEEEDGDEDCIEKYKILFEQAKHYWEEEGMCVEEMKKGFKHIDRAKAEALEKQWRNHLEAAMRVELNGHRLEWGLRSLLLGKKKRNGNRD